MSASNDDGSSGFFAPGKSSARDLARSTPASRSVSRSRSSAKTKHGKKVRQQPMGPTPERMAKGDVVRATGGAMVAQGGLETLRRTFKSPDPTKGQAILKRLHHRVALAEDPGMNERMFEAGKRYEELVERSGLGGIAAQNLLGAGGGSGHPAYSMPATDAARRARMKLRQAWDILPDEATRALHGLLVEGRDAESVGREASMYTQSKECRVAGVTLLRIALSMLVAKNWA